MFSIFLALSGCRPDGPQVVIFPTNPTTLDALAASPTPAEGQRWSWRWLRDGIWIEDLHGPRVPADQTRRGEIWALEVQQLEPERSRITETSVQIGNAPPLVEVHLRRSATVRDAPLEAEVEASDPDGDPLELSYAWSRGGLGIEGGATIGADQLSLGQRWQVTVTANDGVDSSSATASMVIGNHPPAVVSLELQPAVFGETDEVRAVVEATDPDGEEPKIEVTWFVEGQSVHEGPTLTGASFDRGDEVYARAVATDGMESSPPVASAISVVANTPPQTVQIELSPPAPSTLDEVTVEVALSDPDGDLSTFNVIWYADGAEIERGHRLAPGLVQRGQQLMAEVIATDGLSFGPPVQSAVLTVADAPPTIPPVSLQPSNAHADEPLRCHLGADVAGADVVDADGDLVEVAIQWTVDGAPYTGPLVRHRIDGDTIPAGQLGFGQSWGCSVDAITELASSRALSEPLVVPDPPGGNVLLVILDDVGVDKMPSFGAYPNQPDLPTLDRIAASGIAFTNTWAHPVCSPSRAALFTGRLPHRTGMGATSDSKDNHYDLPPAEVTLPEALRLSPLGYTSALLGKWHLNDTQDTSWPSLVLEQGWDHFAGTASNLGLHHLPGPTPAELGLTGDTGQELPSFGYYLFEKYDDGALGWETTYATTDTVDDGIELLSTLPEPWLITVSLHAAHIPMDEPPAALHHQGPLDNAPGWVLYNAILEAADTELARLFSSVSPEQAARTTVIVLGDNGTPREAIVPPFDPLKDKGTMYEGGIRVPLIVSGPLVTQPGTQSLALVHVNDVFATISEIAGVRTSSLRWEHGQAGDGPDTGRPPRTGPVQIDGRTLLPFLSQPHFVDHRREFLYTERFSPNGQTEGAGSHQRTIRNRTHKLLVDVVEQVEELWEITPRVPDEGPGLIGTNQVLTQDQLDSYADLTLALEAQVSALSYDHEP